jgi:hypothetical protein
MNTELSIITIINLLHIYFFVLSTRNAMGKRKYPKVPAKTTQMIWMKSGTGSLCQDMPFQFNFVMYRASRPISSNGILFLLFYHKNKKDKFVPCTLWKLMQGTEIQFESFLAYVSGELKTLALLQRTMLPSAT